jgi:hypothetical protein
VEYVERTQERLDFSGFVLVRREMFAKINCPAITIKYDQVYFNVRAIKKLDGCPFIQILINTETKRLIARPCEEDDKESVQWCRINKEGKLVPKHIGARLFSAKLYNDLGWNISATMKMLGTLVKAGNEKIFVFEMKNAEAYVTMASQTDENRRVRVPFQPEHFATEYGPTLEEVSQGLISTYEGVPEGFVSIRMAPVKAKSRPLANSSSLILEEANGKNTTIDLSKNQPIANEPDDGEANTDVEDVESEMTKIKKITEETPNGTTE